MLIKYSLSLLHSLKIKNIFHIPIPMPVMADLACEPDNNSDLCKTKSPPMIRKKSKRNKQAKVVRHSESECTMNIVRDENEDPHENDDNTWRSNLDHIKWETNPSFGDGREVIAVAE